MAGREHGRARGVGARRPAVSASRSRTRDASAPRETRGFPRTAFRVVNMLGPRSYVKPARPGRPRDALSRTFGVHAASRAPCRRVQAGRASFISSILLPVARRERARRGNSGATITSCQGECDIARVERRTFEAYYYRSALCDYRCRVVCHLSFVSRPNGRCSRRADPLSFVQRCIVF